MAMPVLQIIEGTLVANPVPHIMEDTVKIGEIMEVVQVKPQELMKLIVKIPEKKTSTTGATVAMRTTMPVTTATSNSGTSDDSNSGDENNDTNDANNRGDAGNDSSDKNDME